MFISLAGARHGGLQVLSLRLAQQFKMQGHDVRIVARFAEASPLDYVQMEAPRVIDMDGVEVEIISVAGWRRWLLFPISWLRRRPRTFPFSVALYQAVFRTEVDRVTHGADVIHYFGHGVEILGYAAGAGARRKHIPFVTEPAVHVGQAGHGHADLPLYRRSDMVIAHTEFEAETLRQQGVEADHLQVLRHGFDALEPGDGDRFRRKHEIAGPMVLFVGRRCHDKGYFLLLEAFAALRRRLPDVTLVIMGPGDAAPSTAEGVLELGRVSDEVKRDGLSACTVFCMPSKGESFGMAYFEAWSCGKPVVALDLPVLRETVGTSGGGLLAAPGRMDDLVEQLQQLLTKPELAAEMGARGREFSRGYSWSAAAQSCLEAYAKARQNQLGSSG